MQPKRSKSDTKSLVSKDPSCTTRIANTTLGSAAIFKPYLHDPQARDILGEIIGTPQTQELTSKGIEFDYLTYGRYAALVTNDGWALLSILSCSATFRRAAHDLYPSAGMLLLLASTPMP